MVIQQLLMLFKVCNRRLHIEKRNHPFWALLHGLDIPYWGLHFLVEIELKMAKIPPFTNLKHQEAILTSLPFVFTIGFHHNSDKRFNAYQYKYTFKFKQPRPDSIPGTKAARAHFKGYY